MQHGNLTESKLFRTSLPLLLAVIGSSMFGIAPLFVRIADIGPTAVGGYRILFAIPLLYFWKLIEERIHPQSKRILTKNDFKLMVVAGLFFAGDLALWNISIHMTTIVNATLFNSFVPLFIPLLMWILYKEIPTWHYVIIIILALIGSAMLSGQDISLDPEKLGGDILALISALSYTFYVIALKNMRKNYNTPTILLGSGIITCIAMFIISYFLNEKMLISTTNDWIGILGLALLSHILGQGLMSYAMGHLSAKFIGLSLLIAPLVSVIAGWIAFDETLNIWQIIGCLVVVSSLLVARYEEKNITS